MSAVVLYFHVHQPWRLRPFSFFDIGQGQDYFDDAENARILRRVARLCYLPMNALLLRLIERHEGAFRCAFSITGPVLEQMERWAPEALASFERLVATGCVEVLAETSCHSLAFLGDPAEFRAQVAAHRADLEARFATTVRSFRNTELVLDNEVARIAEDMGFVALLGEGADRVLGWRSPHGVYRPAGCERIGLLLRSYSLSDDIAFRFTNQGWSEWPLCAPKFASWLERIPGDAACVGLFMDFETAGEHQAAETGILEFMEALPGEVLGSGRLAFRTPSEVVARHAPQGVVDTPRPVSWADEERDLTAWLGNAMQQSAHGALYALGAAVRAAAAQGRPDVLRDWRRLTTSDHFYYMCTKHWSDGDVHKYFSPYASPHDAYVTFMNVVDDLERRVRCPAAAPALVQGRE